MAVQLMPRDIQRLRKAMAQVRHESFFRSFRNLLRARLFFDTFLILIFSKDGTPEPLETWIRDPVLAHNYPRLYTAGAYRLDPFFQYRKQIGDGGLPGSGHLHVRDRDRAMPVNDFPGPGL